MSTHYIKNLNKIKKSWETQGNGTELERALAILDQYTKVTWWQKLFSRKHVAHTKKMAAALEFFHNTPKDQQTIDSLLNEIHKAFKVTNINTSGKLALTIQVILINTKPSAIVAKATGDKFGAGMTYKQARKLLKRYTANRFVRFWRGELKNKHTKEVREFLKEFDKTHQGQEVTAMQLLVGLQAMLADKKIELSDSSPMNSLLDNIQNNLVIIETVTHPRPTVPSQQSATTQSSIPPSPQPSSETTTQSEQSNTNTQAGSQPATQTQSERDSALARQLAAQEQERQQQAEEDARLAREQQERENQRLLEELLAREAEEAGAAPQEPPQADAEFNAEDDHDDPELAAAIAASLQEQQAAEAELAAAIAASLEEQQVDQPPVDEQAQRREEMAQQDAEYEAALRQDQQREAEQARQSLIEIVQGGVQTVQSTIEQLVTASNDLDRAQQSDLLDETNELIGRIQTILESGDDKLTLAYQDDNNYFITLTRNIERQRIRVETAVHEIEQQRQAAAQEPENAEVEFELPSSIQYIRSLEASGEFKLNNVYLTFSCKAAAENFVIDATRKCEQELYIPNFARDSRGEDINTTVNLTLHQSKANDRWVNATLIVNKLKEIYPTLVEPEARSAWRNTDVENNFHRELATAKQSCLETISGLSQIQVSDTVFKNGNGRINQCTLQFASEEDAEGFKQAVLPNPIMMTEKSNSPLIIKLLGMRNQSALDMLNYLKEFDYTPEESEELSYEGGLNNIQ